jgi:hypothetical protein
MVGLSSVGPPPRFKTSQLLAIWMIVGSPLRIAKSGRYTGDTSQAAAVSNECLNPIFDSNEDIDNAVGVGNCGGIISQQDESGSAAAPITSQAANLAIELQRTTTSPPVTGEPDPITTCVNCFNGLTDAQRAAFEAQLPIQVDETITTIEELCEFIDQNPQDASSVLGSVEIILESIDIQPGDISKIITCLEDAFNL